MNRFLHRTSIVALGIVFFLLASPFLLSQGNETQLPGIQEFLNPDGTFNDASHYNGQIDTRGWQITTAPDGTPRFVPERTGLASSPTSVETEDENWADGFGGGTGSNGIDDEVFALATDGIRLYIGGAFTKAGDVAANNIVSWDGTRWQILGTGPGILNGVNGIVNAITVDGDIIYVGGQFTNAGGTPVQNIARYSISSRTWANVTNGITGTSAFVSTIMIDGNDVYVGGTFSRAGGGSANNIAVWNKTDQRWRTLGSGATEGVQGGVLAIAKGPDGFYVGGNFSSAGGVASSGVARWDGTAWHSLAGGVNGYVNAIGVIENRVFVGGEFNLAGDTAVNNIARWYTDSAQWSRLTGVMELVGEYFRVEGNGVNNVVRSITVDGNNVYVGGTFNSTFPGDRTLSDINANYIARWWEPTDREWWQTNIWWSPLGRGARNGTNGFVNDVAVYKGQVYAGGAFSVAGEQNADRIARLDGDRWRSLVTTNNNYIFNLAVTDGGDVYVGGEFNQSTSANKMGIAKLNGTQWSSVQGEISGSIHSMTVAGDWIYVGGWLSQVGTTPAMNVARWNRVTEEWGTLGAKPGPGPDIEHFFDTLNYVSAIAVKGDDVYLGGQFNRAGGIRANNIVRWNSATDTWTSLGSGINGSVASILFNNDDMYVAGRFLGAGDQLHAKNIALWKDDTWHALDTGTNEAIWAMGLRGSELFVGGAFTRAGTIDANYLAVWNTESKSWGTVGEGINNDFLPVITALALTDRKLYIGGTFNRAGDKPASNIASWDGSEWNSLGSGVNGYVYQIGVYSNKVYVTGAFSEAGAKASIYFGIYTDLSLSVEERDASESSLALEQNSPNPFIASTTIPFRTVKTGRVSLSIHDVNGGTVARIVENVLPAGEHRILWSPEDIPAGVYFCRLEADGQVITRKLVKQ